ncbi:hypothetical protein OAS39_04130 [Pirellulales bacterium]|nr:hypothetical protein [Pirellulales bacterium]
MSIFRFTTEISNGTIHLPADVELPAGEVEVTIVQPPTSRDGSKRPRSSLAEWADQHAEHWGDELKASDPSTFTGREF